MTPPTRHGSGQSVHPIALGIAVTWLALPPVRVMVRGLRANEKRLEL
jgi:hypothetical protein